MENYFYEAFEGLTRQGPGSKASTTKAISLLDLDRNKELNILDIGCGTGAHTVLLTEGFPHAHITAIDTNESSLSSLKEMLQEKGLENRVTVQNASMFELDFPPETFDLIWSEGSIYIIGFQQGLERWKPFLKQGGYLACSEISWLHENPSEASKSFWEEGYPGMDTISNKINQITGVDYKLNYSFVLPKSDWIEEYYNPLESSLQKLEAKYKDNSEALSVVEMIRQEISLYHHHFNDYSYVFYGMQK
ncbi:class I SAM-dependent methyltransferase [Paenibacillus sp. NPDC058071]|uniref:class I SAM-dependent methyltransferase n=1 Tax=Paenibacillus sp. NPDC058071 TaxID=3346326 RepID=UPI0036D75AFB